MAGLGQRIFGAALVGVGQGMAQAAQQRRQDALMELQRQWRQEDKTRAEEMTQKGWDRADERAEKGYERSEEAQGRAEDLTRAGWDRADARADQASAAKPPPKPERLYAIPEDALTGEGGGYETRDEALSRSRQQSTEAGHSEAVVEAEEVAEGLESAWWDPFETDKDTLGVERAQFVGLLAGEIASNPGVPPETLGARLVARLKGQKGKPGSGMMTAQAANKPGRGAEKPPADYPNAKQAADGFWYVKDKQGQWFMVQ